MERFLQAETLVIELLLIASLVAIAVRRLNVSYTVALVVIGLLISFQSPLGVDLTPELILALFLPPLVFEAAFHVNLTELRKNLTGILMLAVPGVLITTFVVGGLVAWATPLSLPLALVFGALVAATDPVAVVAVFRALPVPKRLSVILESESLFNDGTAIVVFNLALAAALTGHFSPVEGIITFIRVAAGGILIGLILGWLISQVIARVDDYLIETTLTTVLAFGAYLIAERLDVSGVLAVAAAGLINGNIGQRGMMPRTRTVLFSFWEYAAFLANSFVFLLIGLEINLAALADMWQTVVWAIAAVLIARVIVVYGLSWVVNRRAEEIPLRWQHVLAWGGLRGAISLALALSLPASLGAERDLIRVMAFGVVLFTLLAQATTMRPLVRALRLVFRSEAQVEYETRRARLTAVRAAEKHLDHLHAEGLVATPTWEKLKSKLALQTDMLSEAVREVLETDRALSSETLATARRAVLRAQRSALFDLRRDGVVSDDVFESLVAEVEAKLQDAYESEPAQIEDTGPTAADTEHSPAQ